MSRSGYRVVIAGFTLVEVLVALAIVAVALAALGSIVTSGCSRIPAATSTLRAEAEQLELPPGMPNRSRPP